jgi:hypothetical protein
VIKKKRKPEILNIKNHKMTYRLTTYLIIFGIIKIKTKEEILVKRWGA